MTRVAIVPIVAIVTRVAIVPIVAIVKRVAIVTIVAIVSHDSRNISSNISVLALGLLVSGWQCSNVYIVQPCTGMYSSVQQCTGG